MWKFFFIVSCLAEWYPLLWRERPIKPPSSVIEAKPYSSPPASRGITPVAPAVEGRTDQPRLHCLGIWSFQVPMTWTSVSVLLRNSSIHLGGTSEELPLAKKGQFLQNSFYRVLFGVIRNLGTL